MDNKLGALHDSLKVAQGELISTMELLWKQNKKAVNDDQKFLAEGRVINHQFENEIILCPLTMCQGDIG